MATEIERKFLVNSDDYKTEAYEAVHIVQGFLSSVPERVVRVRIWGERGFITIKGISGANGVSRYEWEHEIPVGEARELLLLCEPGVIDKTRHLVRVGGLTFEVDEFHGDNEGLTVAEVELPAEDTPYGRPAWLGEEVTGDPRYYNASLSRHPYSTWR